MIFGRASGFGTIDLTNLASTDGFIIQGQTADDLAGFSVSGAGDIDGDGFDDLIIGAPQNGQGGENAGAAYVISGRLQFGDARNDFNGDGRSDILWRNDTWPGHRLAGPGQRRVRRQLSPMPSRALPIDWQVAGTGDFNGDGRDDILWRNNDGRLTDWLGDGQRRLRRQ